MFGTKKLYQVSWITDFGHATVDHSAAVIARSGEAAAKKAKQFYNLEANKTIHVTERGETYVHRAEVQTVSAVNAVAKEANIEPPVKKRLCYGLGGGR